MSHRSSLLFSCIVLAMTSSCLADVSGSSGGGAIPDDTNSGVVSTITITDAETIQNARFGIQGLAHTWVGDLSATVIHTDTLGNSTNARLFFRTGKASSSGPGDSSDVNGTYLFRDDASPTTGDWWAEAGATGNGPGDSMTPGTYRASDNFGGFVDLDSIFGGKSTAGTWSLRLSDHNPQETGSFTGFTAEFITSVPEPTGAMAVIGLGALFLRRRRSA